MRVFQIEVESSVEVKVRNILPRILQGVGNESRSGRVVRMLNMARQMNNVILRLLVFHGTERENVEQHWSTCDVVWAMK